MPFLSATICIRHFSDFFFLMRMCNVGFGVSFCLIKPSETDDAIASAYLYAAKGDSRAALTQAVSDAVVAIEELRSRLEQAEQVVSYGFTRGEFVTRPRF